MKSLKNKIFQVHNINSLFQSSEKVSQTKLRHFLKSFIELHRTFGQSWSKYNAVIEVFLY